MREFHSLFFAFNTWRITKGRCNWMIVSYIYFLIGFGLGVLFILGGLFCAFSYDEKRDRIIDICDDAGAIIRRMRN